ncbi:hypothetical protein [Micromonospora sp. IBHARD004]|uniref:hypothetical protein n=1 Tax=Micromonospora sp. IBHARD004 TaxID=3457764 RepID=UPI00405A2658
MYGCRRGHDRLPADQPAEEAGHCRSAHREALTATEWDATGRADCALADKDLVTLGFDGSRDFDATALVACRVSDGHLELLECWQPPEQLPGATAKVSKQARAAKRRREEGGVDVAVDDIVNDAPAWQVDRVAVDAAVAEAMKRFVGVYCDPAHWQEYVDKWTAEYGDKMPVKASVAGPLEWWTNRPRFMVLALERFHEAYAAKRVR